MKYVEAPKFGGPEVLRLIEADMPGPGEGMLLVEVQAAGTNYADVLARSGFYPTIRKAPFVLGFEVAGVVREVGKCVEGFKEEMMQCWWKICETGFSADSRSLLTLPFARYKVNLGRSCASAPRSNRISFRLPVPASPITPVPNSTRLPGSGVGWMPTSPRI